jgi:hypothetical protein
MLSFIGNIFKSVSLQPLKNSFLILVFVLTANCSLGQYASPSVLGSAGGSGVYEDMSLSWTMGESVILTLEGTSSELTCGFHQSDQICNGDFNFDGQIDTTDLLTFLVFLPCEIGCLADLNFDGVVDTSDLLIFLSIYGSSCY